ncbi:hypothetical protein [Shinella sp. JR1-6]|uniref:hypothetical protein n=1 Tax=Shinella sp. JR1-6 TaxID=2527671 RepID=UPI00102D3BF5|nr:hypothetical protein [Shinella sp. JR1-6]TAA54614.1 hypothetical protein EXZ48_26680 [Shinella sp. JR1-6]
MPKPSFRMSVESRLLLQELKKIEVGEIITYGRMRDITSLPLSKLRAPLRTATIRAMRDHDMVFGCVRNEGFRRLNDAEIVEDGAANAKSVRRKALRALERQAKADFENLTRLQQAAASAQASILGTVAMMTQPRSLQKVADAVAEGVRELPVAATLSMFIKKQPEAR